jgi:ribulose-5-phosphate 4-epimerase/fuculose-1-phosphate aldolase
MQLRAVKEQPRVQDLVSEEEWKLRQSLAAMFRICGHYEWDDHLFSHISVRAPGDGDNILIGPMSRRFEEITASSLQKLDPNGEHVIEQA